MSDKSRKGPYRSLKMKRQDPPDAAPKAFDLTNSYLSDRIMTVVFFESVIQPEKFRIPAAGRKGGKLLEEERTGPDRPFGASGHGDCSAASCVVCDLPHGIVQRIRAAAAGESAGQLLEYVDLRRNI